jgi:hypothetical protein
MRTTGTTKASSTTTAPVRKATWSSSEGNLALRDHADNGEDVHLFDQEPEGLRYRGQMVVAGWNWKDDLPDKNHNPRRAIVFDLVALDEQLCARCRGAVAVDRDECRAHVATTVRRKGRSRRLG